jgi:hypothetical protein
MPYKDDLEAAHVQIKTLEKAAEMNVRLDEENIELAEELKEIKAKLFKLKKDRGRLKQWFDTWPVALSLLVGVAAAATIVVIGAIHVVQTVDAAYERADDAECMRQCRSIAKDFITARYVSSKEERRQHAAECRCYRRHGKPETIWLKEDL